VVLRGEEGAPLSDDLVVFRLASATSDGRMIPEHFVLSSEDKKSIPPRLSVWVDGMTTLEQADALTQHRNALAGFLPVKAIHALRPHPDDALVRSLCVEWELPTELEMPGADGHAGIAGLEQDGRDTRGQGLKPYRKSLRGALARLANETRIATLRR